MVPHSFNTATEWQNMEYHLRSHTAAAGGLSTKTSLNAKYLMRDLINIIELLTEATGLAGRKPGDVFRNANGNELIFNDIRFFPEEGGRYEPQEMDNVLVQIGQQAPEIAWQNKRTGQSGGMAVASFTGEQGEVFIGRFLQNVKPAAFDNYIPNSFGDYHLNTKVAVKSKAGLMPQDLLLDTDNLTIQNIMEQLSVSLGTDHPLYAVAHSVATGQKLPIKFPAVEGLSFSAFTNYFCEILQPMALQNGLYTGTAARAAEIFLDGGFAGTKISFDFSKTAGLSDSTMTNENGQEVKVSTKSGKGAEASTKNLVDAVNEIQHSPEGQKIVVKYEKTIEMINRIQKEGQAGAPLYLGVEFGIINENEAKTIQKMKNTSLIDLRDLNEMSLSPNLKKLAKSRSTDTPKQTNLYYHLMAAVAFAAAHKVNKESDFSDAATHILSNSALIQMYTKATEGKEEWTLTGFDTRWPGLGIKGVYISAAKNYFSTQIKGNFTFKIDRGTGITKDSKELLPVDSPEVDDAELTDVADAVANSNALNLVRPKQTVKKGEALPMRTKRKS